MTRLDAVAIDLAEANAFVERVHRHHRPVVGHKFSIGASRWIPVTERLPENDDYVWVTVVIDKRELVLRGHLGDDCKWYAASDIRTVLAWQPINKPEAYKP